MFQYERTTQFSQQLSNEEINKVEQIILNTPKNDWSFEDLYLFNLWFYECGAFVAGVKHLMRDHDFTFTPVGRRKKVFGFHKAINQQASEDVVQDWIMSFLGKLNYDPGTNLSDSESSNFELANFTDGSDPVKKFYAYFRVGIKLKANPELKKQSRSVEIDSTDNNGVSLLDRLESAGYLTDFSNLKNINSLEARDIVEKLFQIVDVNNKNVRAFLLHHVYCYQYSEIAQIEEISIGNVKVRVNRGRDILKDAIDEILKDKNDGNIEEVK